MLLRRDLAFGGCDLGDRASSIDVRDNDLECGLDMEECYLCIEGRGVGFERYDFINTKTKPCVNKMIDFWIGVV